MSSSILAAGLIQAFLELTLYGTGIAKSPMIFVVLAVVLQFFTITATHVILAELTNSITDCLVIHRLYVTWDYRLNVVAVPLLFLAAQIGGEWDRRHPWFFVQNLENYRAASIGWVTTDLTTSLIMSVNRTLLPVSSNSSRRRHLMAVLVIVIESAALQSTMNLALLVAFHSTTSKVPNFILKGIQAVVLGLSTVLVHAYSGLGWTQDIPATKTNPTTVSFTLDFVRTMDTEAAESAPCVRE
ncbi:hypothetical protein B0H13DRAFT_1951380 [Mycena leptocephala]|nr:hypothetical protein B0H13DRAFT_1951380 [Mycena leptocephala]